MTAPDLTPPPDRDLPAMAQRRSALVDELRAPRPRPRRRRYVLLVPAGLLATTGAAWAAGIFGAPVKDITAIVCQAEAQPGARSATLPTFLSGQLPGSATEVCLAVPEVVQSMGYVRSGRVRPLVTCRGERHAVVVPGADAAPACERLGLDPMAPQAFRAEVRRQVGAYRLVAPLLPDPDDEQEIDAGEAPDCILAGTLRRRAHEDLRSGGFEDFRVRLGAGASDGDCSAELRVATDADGRTIEIASDGADDSSARRDARDTLAGAACTRLRRDGRAAGAGDAAVYDALACIDAELLAARGRGLQPAEARAAVRDRLGLPGWRVVVTVAPGRGIAQFDSTEVDRAKRTIEIGFVLRHIVAPR